MSNLESRRPQGPPVFNVGDVLRGALEESLLTHIPPYTPEGYSGFYAACLDQSRRVPVALREWAEEVRMEGYGLIRNLPIDRRLSPTPATKGSADQMPMLSDAVVGCVGAMFGVLYTFATKTTPRHIHNVYAVVGDADTQLGSSRGELAWHVEDGFHYARPHWVCLLCLRGDPGAITRVARVKDMQLSADSIARLRKPNFRLRVDESFDSTMESQRFNTTVLHGANDALEVVFDPAFTECTDALSASALQEFGEAADRAQSAITLQAGELLVFNNRRVIHGRSAYQPRMDGGGRWLKRALILDHAEWAAMLDAGVMPV
jgi:L-asparagine oxygenase